jgi:hypothetical protein
VSHVLIVPAIKFSNPMMLFVLVKTNDATIHQLLRVAQSNAQMGMSEARKVRGLTNQGNRRPPRRAAPPVGVRVDRVVRPHPANYRGICSYWGNLSVIS